MSGWSDILSVTKQDIRALSYLSKRLRFLADECVSMVVFKELRNAGLNVRHVIDLGYRGKPDSVIFELARSEKRVLITHDDDFSPRKSNKFSLHISPGVIKLPGSDKDFDVILRAMASVIASFKWQQRLLSGSYITAFPDGSFDMQFIDYTGKRCRCLYDVKRWREVE